MNLFQVSMIILPVILIIGVLLFLRSTIKSRRDFLREMNQLGRSCTTARINMVLILLAILFISSLESCSKGNSGEPVTRWQHIQQMRETSNIVFNESADHTPDQIKYHAIQIHTIDFMLNSELMTIIKK